MCKVKARVVDGFIDSEKFAYVEEASGETCEVLVGATKVSRDSLEVTEVAREKDRVLVELPRESSRGFWRIWVRPAQLIAG